MAEKSLENPFGKQEEYSNGTSGKYIAKFINNFHLNKLSH